MTGVGGSERRLHTVYVDTSWIGVRDDLSDHSPIIVRIGWSDSDPLDVALTTEECRELESWLAESRWSAEQRAKERSA